MALAIEAAELMEPFRWVECDESRRLIAGDSQRLAVADEIADVGILLLNMCLSTGIDLSEAIEAKLKKNAVKYPSGQ